MYISPLKNKHSIVPPSKHQGLGSHAWNAGGTALGGVLDYKASRSEGLNKKQSAAVAATAAPINYGTFAFSNTLKQQHHYAANKAGLAKMNKKGVPAKKGATSLKLDSKAGKVYKNAAKPVLRRGFAVRAGVIAGGTVAAGVAVKKVQHHFVNKNARAANKHPGVVE